MGVISVPKFKYAISLKLAMNVINACKLCHRQGQDQEISTSSLSGVTID